MPAPSCATRRRSRSGISRRSTASRQASPYAASWRDEPVSPPPSARSRRPPRNWLRVLTRPIATPLRSIAFSRSAAAISTFDRQPCWPSSGFRWHSIAQRSGSRVASRPGSLWRLILLSRFDVLLLDEPTNDLDFDGLERLERFVASVRVGARHRLARPRLPRSNGDAGSPRSSRAAAGCASGPAAGREFAAARDAAREGAYRRLSEAQERRRHLAALLAERRNQARAGGAKADRRGTHALMTKVRQAERLLERNEVPEKPFEPWQLQLVSRLGHENDRDRGAPRRRRRVARGASRSALSTSISFPESDWP